MTGLPKLGAPAHRALDAAGIGSLEQLAARTEDEVTALHGIGPNSLVKLREALAAHGLAYRTERPSRAAGGARPASRAAAKQAGPVETRPRIYTIKFNVLYPLYLQKAERKGRTQSEVDAIIAWLTGYRGARLQQAIASEMDLEAFFAKAPKLNPNAGKITGMVCGMRVEDIADPVERQIRYMDKLIDELARGKKLESILRQ